MKKVLSLVLAFAMILGSFGFVFANQYPDVKDTEYYSEPVNVLSGLGVVGGFPDGSFQPTGKITRAQMAVMLINALGIPVSGKADTPFSDVPAAHWASGYIKYAANMGYVAGYTDGSFKPDKEVSYDEALTMIVAALGYTSEGLTGNWPGNFVNAARGLGILSICKTTGSAPATRADVCCFLYKALTSPIGRTNKDGEFIKTVTGKDADGNDVYDTMIDRLGAVDYDPDENGPEKPGAAFVVMGDEDSLINLGEYLGAFITAYANEDGEIIAIKEVKSIFVEDTVKNIKKNYSKTADGVWTKTVPYFENGEDTTTKKAIGTYQPGEFEKDDTIKIAVSVKSKEITELYSIQVWDVTADGFAADDVQEDINEDHKLLGEKFVEDDDEEIDMNSFVLLGRDSLADIAEDDVVYVYSNSKGIAKIEVGTETIEGTISKMGDKVTVGGKAYAISAEADAGLSGDTGTLHDAMKNETEGTFYLDYAGAIYDFSENDNKTDGYGVLLNKWDEIVKGKISYYAEIFQPDGSAAEYKFDTEALYNAAPALGTLVKFEKNSKSVLTAMTAGSGDADWEISKNGVVSGLGYKIATSTVAFKFNGSDKTDAASYKVLEASSLFGGKATHVESYMKDNSVKAMLVKGAAGEATETVAYVVEKGEDTPSGTMYTVLYDGKVQELNFEVTPTLGTFCTLTIDNGNVTAIGGAPSYTAEEHFDTAALDAEATSVSGNVFTGPDGKGYDLASDITVYVYNETDKEWSVGSKNDLKAKKGTLKSIDLWSHSSDKAFDYVIVKEK